MYQGIEVIAVFVHIIMDWKQMIHNMNIEPHPHKQ